MKEVYEGIVSFLKNYQERTHVKGYVLGISGGKDSTVVAKLLVGKENILGVLMVSKLILRIVIQYVTFLILTILLLI